MMGRTSLVVLLAAAASGCGGAMPEAPKAPAYTEKHAPRCTDGKSQSRPLIVEWPSSDRADLEARAKRGVVAVHYVGCEMEVLTRCSVPGAYGYTGITPKTDHVTMRDSDEVYANIPVYAAKFEGKLASAGSLDVAMMIVGRYEADRPVVRADELTGDCASATHFVSSLTVGAFEFSAGSTTEAGASVDVMGAGGGAKAQSVRETLNRDGEEKACASAAGDDKAAPFGCGALLRLEVVPLGEARKEAPACPGGTQWDGNQCTASVSTACPEGTALEGAKGCVPKVVGGATKPATKPAMVSPTAAVCSDAAACRAACDKGDQKTCVALGVMLRDGSGVPKDGPAALATLTKACDAGALEGCVSAGEMSYQALGVPKDAAAAAVLFKKACDGGSPSGCVDLAWATSAGAGVARDDARAAELFGRACNDATSIGCVGLGMLVRDGKGVPRDKARAAGLFHKACAAGVSVGCKLEKP